VPQPPPLNKIMSENEQNIPEAKHVETKDGRVHIGSEKDKVDETDPFAPVFHIIEQVQVNRKTKCT